MSKFGVNIDLSIFFEDERKMVLIMVDPKWENVECLQKRVQYLFEVDTVRFINSDGSFLPPQEPIEIIKFCKGLKAFVPKESLEKRKKSKKNKKLEKSLQGSDSEETTNSSCNNNESQNKRKYSSEKGFSSSTPNHAKRIKSINLQENQSKQINKSSEISSTSEQMPPPTITITSSPAVKNKKSKNMKSKASSVTSDYEEPSIEKTLNPCESLSQECSTEVQGNISNVKANNNEKRLTSTPKEKQISEISKNLDTTFNNNLKPRPSSVLSSTFIDESKMMKPLPNNNNPFKRQSSNKSKGHIYFNESGEMVNTITSSKNTTKNEKENKVPQLTIFRCSLNDTKTNALQKPRIFNIKPITKTQKVKQVVEIQEQIILPSNDTQASLSKSQTLEATECQENEGNETKTSEILQNTKSDSLNNSEQDKSHPNDITNTEMEHETFKENLISTENTTEANNPDQTSIESLEKTQSIAEDLVTKSDSMLNQTDTKYAGDRSVSIESVDLSIVIDDDEEDCKKSKKKSQNKRQQQSHDLTYDDQGDDSSDIEEISEIIDLNETDDNNCKSTASSRSSLGSFNRSIIVIHKILPFCTDLMGEPNIGDIIVFKVPYVNKKQKLAETNFIAGKTEYINKRTKSIKLLIVDGLLELSNIPNKFLCNLDDSQDQVKYLQLKLNEMLDAKIYSRS